MTLRILVLLISVFSMVLATFQTAHAANGYFTKRSIYTKQLNYIEGQVVNIAHDEEGSTISIKTSDGSIRPVYVPRARANESIIERAIEAQKTKTLFRISTQK